MAALYRPHKSLPVASAAAATGARDFIGPNPSLSQVSHWLMSSRRGDQEVTESQCLRRAVGESE